MAFPLSGDNFSTYSTLGWEIGRTHMHDTVRKVVLTAYRNLRQSAPGKVFVIGESGWQSGGRMRPHRTHQNGLSVDFMVPVLDAKGVSVPLPGNALNKFGYSIEFDAAGRYDSFRIDFEALGEHLYQLQAAAGQQGIGIALVIFDPRLKPALLKTKRATQLGSLKFLPGPAWVRHDEHYHVDFALPCKPL